jgi:DNA-binding GntR family transcriptional regulator
VEKAIPPGTRVTEASLAAQLNVSKTPVREALLELRQAGLIEDWGRRGGRIVAPSERRLREISETREALATYLARRAAEVATIKQREQVLKIATQGYKAAQMEDSDSYHKENLNFYEYLAEVIDNRMILDLIRKNLTLGAVLRLRDYAKAIPLVRFAEGNLAVAKAISEGKPDDADAAARERIRTSLTYNIDAFRARVETIP